MAVMIMSKIPDDVPCPKTETKSYLAPRVSSINVHYKYLTGKTTEKKSGGCYSFISHSKIQQSIPTNRPATLVELLKYLGKYMPPGFGDVFSWVRPNKGNDPFKYEVILQFVYVPTEEDISVLAWLSFLRAGWEFLKFDDKPRSNTELLLNVLTRSPLGGHLPCSSGYHYAANGKHMNPVKTYKDLFALLSGLRSGRYNKKRDGWDAIHQTSTEILGCKVAP